MPRKKFGFSIRVAVLATLLAVPLLALAPRAEANHTNVTSSGCKATTSVGAQISTYPAWGASQSGIRVACVWDSRSTSGTIPSAWSIHDWHTAVWHNGSARSFTSTAGGLSGTNTITLNNCDGISATSARPWENHPITRVGSDAGMPTRSFVRSISAACVATLSENFTANIPVGTSLLIDNSHARSVDDGTVSAGANTLSSATANFTQADVGLSVSGTRIPLGTTIATVVNATNATLSQNTPSGSVGDNVITMGGTLEPQNTRTVNHALAGKTANTIQSAIARFRTGFATTNPNCASTAPLSCGDTGLRVTGTGLTNCVIASVAGTTATMTTNCVNTVTFNGTFTIGEPSITATQDGDGMLTQGVQLDLSPTLVAGSNGCNLNDAEGFSIVGTWLNPGSFVTGVLAPLPADSRTVGEVFFDTSAVDYGGYIVERGINTAGDLQANPHYDIVFPSVPIGVAMCSSANSPGVSISLGIPGSTPSQAQVRQGNGKPGSSQLRAIREDFNLGWSGTAYVTRDDAGVPAWTGSEFERLCIIPAADTEVGLKCGTG